MSNEIKENPEIVAALEKEKSKSRFKPNFVSCKNTNNDNIKHKYISAKAISNVGLFILLCSIVIGVILALFAKNTAIVITVLIISIVSGIVSYFFFMVLAEIVYQLQNKNNK